MQLPKVTIITLNWNGKVDTLECLNSLRQLRYANFDTVVVDNGSTDGSVDTLRAQHPDITVLANDKNLGYAEGFNIGIRRAYQNGADYFLIVNNDTVLDPDALAEMVKIAEQDARIGFVSGKVFWYTKRDVLQTVGRLNDPLLLIGPHIGSGQVDHGQFDQVCDYDFVDDVFLLVRRAAYEAVGGYDPAFFLYFEETDWCARVRRAGFRIVYAPGSRIWHKGIIGNENLPLSPKRIFYLQRNEIPFMWRNASRALWRAYLWHLFTRIPRRSAHYLKHRRVPEMIAYLNGVCSGMLWLWQNRHRSRTSRSNA